jgi:creatinine amidohydrolase
MSYSVFEGTMADMTYLQLEAAAEMKLPVLFPIGVIEEHGPHMCLGTDTYMAYSTCRKIKDALKNKDKDCLIAPAYYWGINICTGGFAGSFTVKPETMSSVLSDLLECIRSWGFETVYLLNFHGDFLHNKTILNTVKDLYNKNGAGAYFIIPNYLLNPMEVTGKEPYLAVQPDIMLPGEVPEFMDIHAGGIETSLMLNEFPQMVDMELAQNLKSSMTTAKALADWQKGGITARNITPYGYCGNPSDLDLKSAAMYMERNVKDITELILGFEKLK